VVISNHGQFLLGQVLNQLRQPIVQLVRTVGKIDQDGFWRIFGPDALFTSKLQPKERSMAAGTRNKSTSSSGRIKVDAPLCRYCCGSHFRFEECPLFFHLFRFRRIGIDNDCNRFLP